MGVSIKISAVGSRDDEG